jgi:hypothetical protein
VDESATGSANLYGPTPKASVREADQWKGSGETGRFPQLISLRAKHAKPEPPVAACARGRREDQIGEERLAIEPTEIVPPSGAE